MDPKRRTTERHEHRELRTSRRWSRADRWGIAISVLIGVLTLWYVFGPRGLRQLIRPGIHDPWPRLAASYTAALPAGCAQDIRALRRLLELRWSYLEMRRARGQVDLVTLERDALGVLGETPDRETFERVLRRFIAGLWDGHAAVELPKREPVEHPRMLPMVLVDVVEGIANRSSCRCGVAWRR